jgi:hypothetical protein
MFGVVGLTACTPPPIDSFALLSRLSGSLFAFLKANNNKRKQIRHAADALHDRGWVTITI